MDPKKKDAPKKKRGRKRKCETNMENYQQISGFVPGSIDTTDDGMIKFSESVHEPVKGESFKFGSLNITRIVVPPPSSKTVPDTASNTSPDKGNENECMIDLSTVEDVRQENPPRPNVVSAPVFLSKAKKKKDGFVVLNQYKEAWPESTDVWCWWCCHPFSGIPRFLPTHYDPLRKRFRVKGNFCSWSCAKAYMIKEDKARDNGRLFLELMNCIRHKDVVRPAPPRQTLKVFGGPLAIEDFRRTDKSFEILNLNIQLDTKEFIAC